MKRLLPLSIIAALTILAAVLLTAGGPLRARGIAHPPVILAGGDTLDVSGDACRVRSSQTNGVLHARCVEWTPTATPTLAVTPSSTNTPTTSATVPLSTPTDTPTVAPSSSPTATPTRGPAAPFALGIRLDHGDSQTLAAWNTKVRAGDNSHSDNSSLLLSVKAGSLSQSVGSSGIVNGAASDAIDGRLQEALASNGRITDVAINDEAGKLCPELISDEAYEYAKFAPFNQAHGTHISMTFVPVGNRIALCGVQAFVTNTDKLVDQVEARQIDANFAAEVHAEIHALRVARPGLPIVTQVSTLPPRVATYSVAQTIKDIDALMDGSADQPDGIQVFYAGRGSIRDNDSDGIAEADEFIAVLNHYR